MTLPEIPPDHRLAVVYAIRAERRSFASPDWLADAAIATMLRLGYRVAPGLSQATRDIICHGFAALFEENDENRRNVSRNNFLGIQRYQDERAEIQAALDEFTRMPPPSSAPAPTIDNNKDAK